MDRSLIYSLLLHGLLFAFIVIRLPFLDTPDPINEPTVFTVELVPISQITNIPTAPKLEPKEKKEKPKPKEEIPPPPPASQPKESKPKTETLTEPKQKDKADIKKPDAKKEKEEKQKTDLDFENSMKNLMKPEKPSPTEDKKPAPPQPAIDHYEQMKAALAQDAMNPYNPNIPVSLSEKDGIRQQFYQCWTPLTGAKNADLLTIKVEIILDRSGYVRDYKLISTSPPPGVDHNLFTAAQQRAVMAIQNETCRRLRHVPSLEKYGGDNGWWRIELTFDHRNYY